MNGNLPSAKPGICWICGGPAGSSEHRFKRSDLVTRYGRSWPSCDRPFILRGDGSPQRSRGPNDRLNLYAKTLCKPCNNARTQAFDRAYETFSDWVFHEAGTLYRCGKLDFRKIYGRPNFTREAMNLLRYFAKCLGCRLADAGVRPPSKLRSLVTSVGLSTSLPLRITFGINEFWRRIAPDGKMLANGDLTYWNIAWSPEGGFTWRQMLGYLEVYYWYDVVWDPFPFGGNPMSGPVRTVRLGRHDPLPNEPATTLKASARPLLQHAPASLAKAAIAPG